MTVPIVPLSKIVNYLLDLNSEDGHPKAKFFMNGGFSRERPEELTHALQRHFLANPPTTKKPDNFGGCETACKSFQIPGENSVP